MKRRGLINALCIAFAGIIMLAGYLVPERLLFDKEKAAVGSASALSLIGGGSSEEQRPTATDKPVPSPSEGAGISISSENERLKAILQCLGRGDGLTAREPTPDELDMDAAVAIARMGFTKLFMSLGPEAYVDIYGYRLEYAQLLNAGVQSVKRLSAYLGVWSISFFNEENGSTVNILLDAEKGSILSASARFNGLFFEVSPFEALIGYAEYLGLDAEKEFTGSSRGSISSIVVDGIMLELSLFIMDGSTFFSIEAGFNESEPEN